MIAQEDRLHARLPRMTPEEAARHAAGVIARHLGTDPRPFSVITRREGLAPFVGQRISVIGTVSRFGHRIPFPGWYQTTMLLVNIVLEDGTPLTDHVWLPLGNRLTAVDPTPGDVLRFTAEVRLYGKQKADQDRTGRLQRIRCVKDFKLSYPTRVQKLPQV